MAFWKIGAVHLVALKRLFCFLRHLARLLAGMRLCVQDSHYALLSLRSHEEGYILAQLVNSVAGVKVTLLQRQQDW